MRISTSQIYTQGLKAFGDQQTKLAHLQEQISTGKRITRPSDDPAASSRILELEQTLKLNQQYQVNINQAENRLYLQESTLTSLENVLQRMRELTLRANNATMDFESRRAVAFEVDQLQEQMVSLSNTIDSNGDYLFAGHQSKNEPFTPNITGSISHVDFNGDAGERLINISQSRQLNVDTSGRELFMQLSSSVALNETTPAANAGSGVLAPAHVFDNMGYVAGDYQIVFTGANTYDVVDLSGPVNVVTGAAYTDSQSIDFQGIRTSITGAPAVGDTFTVSQGQYKDMFSIASDLSEQLNTSLPKDQLTANFEQSLRDIDAAFEEVLLARTSIGGRLNALEAQSEDNEAFIVVTKTTISSLQDTDEAAAISQLALEQATLDAAQAVFARITSSSLFNFLR